MTHLDTSFLIRALVRGSSEDHRLRSLLRAGEGVAISAVCWVEFCCGPVQESDLELAMQLVGDPVPFRTEDARTAARLFNLGRRRRGSLLDCMIAAAALEAEASLATSNPADFRAFETAGLHLMSG